MTDDRDDIYSKAVRAGKRTYFFDVKSTRGHDLFITITESKKRPQPDGSVTYEKHKIFLYKEDFNKFLNGLHDAFDEIDRLRGKGAATTSDGEPSIDPSQDEVTPFLDINVEDLARKDI